MLRQNNTWWGHDLLWCLEHRKGNKAEFHHLVSPCCYPDPHWSNPHSQHGVFSLPQKKVLKGACTHMMAFDNLLLQLIIEQAAWDSKTCNLLGDNSVIFLRHSTITISSSLANWASDWTRIFGEIKGVSSLPIEKVDILEGRLCHWFGLKVFHWQSWYLPGSLFCHQRWPCHQASIKNENKYLHSMFLFRHGLRYICMLRKNGDKSGPSDV